MVSRKSRAASVALELASTTLPIKLMIPYQTVGATLLRLDISVPETEEATVVH